MEIELKELRIKMKGIKLPDFKWWQYMLLFVGVVIIVKGDYQMIFEMLNLIKPYLVQYGK
jgi:hypothetical protein